MKVHNLGVWVGGVPNLLSVPVNTFYDRDCVESKRAAKMLSKYPEKNTERLIASAHWMRKAVNTYDNWWKQHDIVK